MKYNIILLILMYYIDSHAGGLMTDAMIFTEISIFIEIHRILNSDHSEINL